MEVIPTGPDSARIALVGEFPRTQELHTGLPFSGSGSADLQRMLLDAGASLSECFCTYVTLSKVPGLTAEGIVPGEALKRTDASAVWCGRIVTQQFRDGLERLRTELLAAKPNVVCALGDVALFALTGQWSVTQWRSSIMESTLIPGLKVIPTFNPTRLRAQPEMLPIMSHDLKRVVRQSSSPAIVRTEERFLVQPPFEKATAALEALIAMPAQPIAADIETRAGHIACIAFAWSASDAVCIPLMCRHSPTGYWSLAEEVQLVRLVLAVMRKHTIVGQNWNYDAQYIHRYWHFICPQSEDTMIAHHSCFSGMPKNLAFLSSLYLEDHIYWKDEIADWKSTDGTEEAYWRYNCKDAVRTYACYSVLRETVRSMGMESVYQFQLALSKAVLKTMLRGLRIDTAAKAAISQELTALLDAKDLWLQSIIGQQLNPNSSPQMQDFFYRQMGQPVIKNKKTHSVTCDDAALAEIALHEPILRPIVTNIADMRSLKVFRNTFVEAKADWDGRMRTSFNVCGTETYRFSSTKNAFGNGLNMQNIPKGGTLSEFSSVVMPNVRKLFLPDDGMTVFDMDLDSADLRIVTWESGCVWMKEHFAAGRKPYVEVMKEYYRDSTMTKQSHPREYAVFKALCHGSNYLGTPAGMAPRLGLLVNEVERIQRWYFGLAPEIAAWQSSIKEQVLKRRCIQNVFGYRCYFLGKVEGTTFNEAVAWIPQSSVACLINRAYMAIHNKLPEVEVLLQVHDSLVGQFPTAKADVLLPQIESTSRIVLPYSDPTVIPVGVATSDVSWGDCR